MSRPGTSQHAAQFFLPKRALAWQRAGGNARKRTKRNRRPNSNPRTPDNLGGIAHRRIGRQHTSPTEPELPSGGLLSGTLQALNTAHRSLQSCTAAQTTHPYPNSNHAPPAAALRRRSERVGRVAAGPTHTRGRVATNQHQYQQNRSGRRHKCDAPRAPLPHICKRGDARRGHDGEPHEARDYYQFTKTPAARRGRRRRIVNGRRARRALGGPAGVAAQVVGAAERRGEIPAGPPRGAAPR